MKNIFKHLVTMTAAILGSLAVQAESIELKASPVQELQTRYKQIVNNDYEGNIYLKVDQHKNFGSVGEIAGKILMDSYGLEDAKISRLWGKQTKKQVLERLFESGSSAFFCEALIGETTWEETSIRPCEAKVEELLGDTLERADRVYVQEIYGNNFGSWHEVNLIVIFDERKTTGSGELLRNSSTSVVLTFEIHHEI